MVRESFGYFGNIFPFKHIPGIIERSRVSSREGEQDSVIWPSSPFVPPWAYGGPIGKIEIDDLYRAMFNRRGIYELITYGLTNRVRYIMDKVDDRLLSNSWRQDIQYTTNWYNDDDNWFRPEVFDANGNLTRQSILEYLKPLDMIFEPSIRISDVFFGPKELAANAALRVYHMLNSGFPYTMTEKGVFNFFTFTARPRTLEEMRESTGVEILVKRAWDNRGIQVEIPPTANQTIELGIHKGELVNYDSVTHTSSPLKRKLSTVRPLEHMILCFSNTHERPIIHYGLNGNGANGNGASSRLELRGNMKLYSYWFIFPPHQYAFASSG